MNPTQPSDEAQVVRRWRLGHGAVFLVMVMLGLTVAGFAVSNGCELVKPFAAQPPAEIQSPTAE
jgi:hypothetical protein